MAATGTTPLLEAACRLQAACCTVAGRYPDAQGSEAVPRDRSPAVPALAASFIAAYRQATEADRADFPVTKLTLTWGEGDKPYIIFTPPGASPAEPVQGAWNPDARPGSVATPLSFFWALADAVTTDRDAALKIGAPDSAHPDGAPPSGLAPLALLSQLAGAMPTELPAEQQLQLFRTALQTAYSTAAPLLPSHSAAGAGAVGPAGGAADHVANAAPGRDQAGALPALPPVPRAPKLTSFLPGLDSRKDTSMRLMAAADGSLVFSPDQGGGLRSLGLAEFMQCSYAAHKFYYAPQGVGEAYSAHVSAMLDKWKGPFTDHQLTQYDQAHRQAWEEAPRGTYDLAAPSNALFQKHLMAPALSSRPPALMHASSLRSAQPTAGRTAYHQPPAPLRGGAPAKRPQGPSSDADLAKQRCNNFALQRCVTDGSCKRSHACDACGGQAYPALGGCPNGHGLKAVNAAYTDQPAGAKRSKPPR